MLSCRTGRNKLLVSRQLRWYVNVTLLTVSASNLMTCGTVDPSFVFAFIEVFISILEEYLGGISSSLIKDHFDVVYQV